MRKFQIAAIVALVAIPVTAFAAELLNGTGSLDTTANNNTTRFPENMAPAAINDGMRNLESMLARYLKDSNGSVAISNIGNTYNASINADNGAALYDGFFFAGDVTNANTGPVSLILTPDGGSAFSAVTVVKAGDKALDPGDFQPGQKIFLDYDGVQFQLLNPSATNENIDVGSSGELTYPNQPAFLAYNSAQDDNVTGNGTEATVEFDTEVFDRGGNFNNSTDTFTAPVTGLYRLSTLVTSDGYLTTGYTGSLRIVTTNRTYLFANVNLQETQLGMPLSVLTDMNAGDTAHVTFTANLQGSDIIDINSGSAIVTYFSGELVE